MVKQFRSYPFYIKAPMVLVGLICTFYIAWLLQDIFVPIVFAGLIAILLNPVVNKLQKWGCPRILAIAIAVLAAIILVAGIITLISAQVASFTDMWPQLKEKSLSMFHQLQAWIAQKFNYPLAKQGQIINKGLESAQQQIGSTLNTLFGVLSVVVLVPLYVFMILLYKPLLLNFVYEVFEEDEGARVDEILQETKGAVQSYIVGLMLEALIVAALNTVALLILGVKYAFLLGILGALLNLIPYLGGLIAIALPVIISLVTKDGFTTPILIVASYLLIQFIDNNIIVPKVVSSKVSVNAFFSIVIVLLGNALWGIAGMFLSIPIAAVLKIIFDRVNGMKPWGKLLGDKIPNEKELRRAREACMQEDGAVG